MNARDFAKSQENDGRLAEALRNLAEDAQDIRLGETDAGIPMIWPASNIRDVLMRAADRLETLTMQVKP